MSNYDVNKKYCFFDEIDVVEECAGGIEIKDEKKQLCWIGTNCFFSCL